MLLFLTLRRLWPGGILYLFNDAAVMLRTKVCLPLQVRLSCPLSGRRESKRRGNPTMCQFAFARLLLLSVTLLTLHPFDARAKADAKPDLDVTCVERAPLYPAYTVAYDIPEKTGLPILLDPQTLQPLTPAQEQAVKRQPALGEKVTFTARIVNKGEAPTGEWEYEWLVDDKPLASGTFKNPLKPGEFAALSCPWNWEVGAHRVRCRIDPQHKIAQTFTQNDSLEVATDAWLLALTVDQATYDRFNHLDNVAGTRSFEDWAQWHIAQMNQRLQFSPSPLNPRGGSRVRVACNKIVVVPDANQPWPVLLNIAAATPLEAGYDGAWAFGHAPDIAKWAAQTDWGLLHEWGHQLGLTDENALDRQGYQNLVTDAGGDPLLLGHLSSQAGFLMHTPGDTPFSPESMAALETQYGRRRGYYGDYTFAMPALNILLVLDAAARPLPDAQIACWQDEEGVYEGMPAFVGATDKEGKFVLPNRPAPTVTTAAGFTLRDNPFGQITLSGPKDTLFLRITARDQTDYAWLDVAELNRAYWNGNKNIATYVRRTHLSAANALRAPDNLRAELSDEAVTLTWDGVGGAKGYRVYQAVSDQAEWQPVGGLLTETRFQLKMAAKERHRYAVVTIGEDDKESGFSNVAGMLRLEQPWGIAMMRNGRRLIRDRQAARAVLQKPDGSFIGLAGPFDLDLRGAQDVAVDSKGRFISAIGADKSRKNADAPQGFVIQNPDLSPALTALQPPGSLPQHFQNPMGVAVDSRDNIFICDTDNDRIQEYGPDGKFKAIIGVGLLKQPMKLAIDKQNNLIVCDTASDRLTVLRHDADGQYRLHGHANNLPRPVSIVTDAEGRFFVSCQGDDTVVALNSQFYRLPWKYTGTESLRLKAPAGLALDGKGNLLIVDSGNKRIVETPVPSK